METKRKVIHFSQMLHTLAVAEEHGQLVHLKAWKSENGHIIDYKGWKVMHDYWRGGYVRLKNPRNGAIRLVPEILIFEIGGLRVYL